MSQKKLIYDINGKVKEISNTYFETSDNSLNAKNITSNTMSVNLADGIAVIESGTIDTIPFTDNQVLAWNSSTNKWYAYNVPTTDGSSISFIAGSDVSGTPSAGLVRSLSNVSSGTLPVQRGGTGLTNGDISSGNSIAYYSVNNTGSLTLLNVSGQTNGSVIVSTDSGWSFITQSSYTVSDTSIYATMLYTP